MKLKSLILGSVAAAALSTSGFAADLGVLTSLDVCDELGLSGLTISSDTNCLQISGGVSYEFNWGNFGGPSNGAWVPHGGGVFSGGMTPDGVAPAELDWNSKVETWLKFVGTASSDFGPAKAVIKLKSVQHSVVSNEGAVAVGGDATVGPGAFIADEAYVQVGDGTILMAGKKGSVANFDDDEPFNWVGLFNSNEVDKGVMFVKDRPKTGGHVIQVVSDLGNGVNVRLGLENLNGTTAAAGTVVGVLSYAGENLTAHVTGLAGGILDGNVEAYAVHAGFTGTFDAFKIRGAIAADDTGYWNALASAQATFDIFKIAISGEAAGGGFWGGPSYGVGGSIGATVSEGIEINLGAKYFDSDPGTTDEAYHVAAQLVAAVTETIKVTGEIGVWGETRPAATSDFYGSAELAWAPGGGFTSSVKGEAHQNGAYKVTFKAAKSFE